MDRSRLEVLWAVITAGVRRARSERLDGAEALARVARAVEVARWGKAGWQPTPRRGRPREEPPGMWWSTSDLTRGY